MSADNWAFCPRCLEKGVQKQHELTKRVNNAYGKVSAEKWLEMKENANISPSGEPTLREDYEIWTDELGNFVIHYGCHCKECGFNYSFNHEEKLEV